MARYQKTATYLTVFCRLAWYIGMYISYVDIIGGALQCTRVYKYFALYTDPTLVVYGLKLAHMPRRHLFSSLMYILKWMQTKFRNEKFKFLSRWIQLQSCMCYLDKWFVYIVHFRAGPETSFWNLQHAIIKFYWIEAINCKFWPLEKHVSELKSDSP